MRDAAVLDENRMNIKVTPIASIHRCARRVLIKRGVVGGGGWNERIVVTIEPDFMKNALTLETVYFSD